MARARTHKDVDFSVDDAGGQERIFKTFDEAAGFAVGLAASTGETINIDVLIFSKAGAKWWASDHGIEEYESDPEASISQRIAVKADDQGRVY